MTEQEYEQLLDKSVDELPKEIQPPRDLWIGIDKAIDLRRSNKRSRSRQYSQAAVFAILIFGGVWIFSAFLSSNDIASKEVTLSTLVEDIDTGFKAQKASILEVYEGQPALTSTWQKQLRELEVARNGILEALKQNPDNFYMIQMLIEVQHQQLDLIENVHIVSNESI